MDALKIFRDAQPELEQWRQRQVRNPPEEPEPGSELAEDDALFPRHLISETVRFNLNSAGEHLRLIWDGLERGHLYGVAQHSTVRGALVGAVQAMWITAPHDSAVRRRRGHKMIAETYRQLRTYHQNTSLWASDLELTTGQQQQVRDQIDWIDSRLDELRSVEPDLAKVTTTAMFEQVAPVVFPGNPVLQANMRLAWNTLSSDAHALLWGTTTRADFSNTPPDPSTGLSVGITGNDPAHLSNWYALAMHLLRSGWALYGRRSTRPDSSPPEA